jgi:mycothiol synthase
MMLRSSRPGDRPALLALGAREEQIDDADELVVALDGDRLVAARDLRVMGRGDEPTPILETAALGPPDARLFEAVLARAAALTAARGRPRAILQTRCAPEDAAARALFESFGLAEARELWSMRCSALAGLAPPALPAGIEVRPYAPGRHDDAWRLAFNDAFADHWGGWVLLSADAWRRYLARPGFRPELSLVAWDGDQIAGFCHCRLDAPGRGQIRYVGVRPGWRRRGLGEALTRLGMLTLRDHGAESVGLGVDATNTTGAQRLYERLGFVVVGRHLMFRREICASSIV